MTTHRAQYIEYKTWTTWNGAEAESYNWKPSQELQEQMPWLPDSMGWKTLDEAEYGIDFYLDNAPELRRRYQLEQEAAAAWVNESRTLNHSTE